MRFIGLIIFTITLTSAIHASETTPFSVALSDFKSGNLDAALQTINDWIHAEKDPANLIAAHELRGRILTSKSDYPGALAAFQLVVDTAPDRASTHRYVGDVFFKMERWSEAFGAYRYAIELDAQYRDPVLKMVYCLVIMDNLPAAHQWISTLNPESDSRPDYYFARAAMSLVNGKADDYAAVLRQARTLYGPEVFAAHEPDLLVVLKAIRSRGNLAGGAANPAADVSAQTPSAPIP